MFFSFFQNQMPPVLQAIVGPNLYGMNPDKAELIVFWSMREQRKKKS